METYKRYSRLILFLLFVVNFVTAKLIVYEGFDYHHPLGDQFGGTGFDSGWMLSIQHQSQGSCFPVEENESLAEPNVFNPTNFEYCKQLVAIGGCINNTVGAMGSGVRTLATYAQIDMEIQSVRYLSFSYTFIQSDIVSKAKIGFIDFQQNKDTAGISIDNTGNVMIVSPFKNAPTETMLISGETYFFVLKIVATDEASAGFYERFYLKIYPSDRTVHMQDIGFEEEDWDAILVEDTNITYNINALNITAEAGSAFKMDEIRMGTLWFDVVSQQTSDYSSYYNTFKGSDLNEDCEVDIRDFAIIASEWMNCSNPGNAECDIYWLN